MFLSLSFRMRLISPSLKKRRLVSEGLQGVMSLRTGESPMSGHRVLNHRLSSV